MVQAGWVARDGNRPVATVSLRPYAPLSPPLEGDRLVTASIGPAHDAIAIWSDAAGSDRLRQRQTNPGGASFPRTDVDAPPTVRVVRYQPEVESVTEVRGLDIAFPTIQPLPGGRFVVVGCRCRWRPEGPDQNAALIDSAGEVLLRETVGDGINHVLSTPSGALWIGYFDEGVWGNFGWGGPGPEPIGSPGLVRFNARLEPEWRYPFDSDFGAISDCYALNVDREAAWAYYYTDFPVVHIDDGGITGWKTATGGAHALLTDGHRLALIGGYSSDRDGILVGNLTGGRFVETAACALVGPEGDVLPPAVAMVGRGELLHVLTADTWFQVSLDELASAR
jgi:hypothetical protein